MSRRAALEELARRKLTRDAILSECTDWQRDVIVSECRYKSVLAGRRTGKTELDARYLAIELERCGPLDWCLYSAVTRQVAKDLMWERLKGLNERHMLGWEMKEHEGLIVSSRGGKLRLLGFDKMPEVEKACGYRVRLFIADEPHSYALRLAYLVDQKLGPALLDLDGTFVINGTPGIARSGYWWKVSTGKQQGYQCWKKTVHDNSKFPRDVEQALAQVLREKGWTIETPAYQREYMAEWCEDEGQLVYPFVDSRNGCDAVELNPEGLFTLGVDFGMVNRSAWAVQYSAPHSRVVTCVHSEAHPDLLPDQANEVTARLIQQYKPSRIVGDGAAKAYVEAHNRRYGNQAGWYMHPADKLGKRSHQQIMADEMRQGRMRFVRGANAELIDEMSNLVFADETREKEHPGLPNDLCDANLYSFTEHMAYLAIPAPDPVSAEEKARLERFAAAERRRREEAESDYY